MRPLAEPQGESSHGLRGMPRHQEGDRAGVQAAAQKDSQRHVAHQPHLDGLVEPLARFLDVLLERVRFSLEGDVPITRLADAPLLPLQPVSGRQFTDSLENGPRRRNVKVSQVVIEGDVVKFAPDLRVRQQGFHLRPEEETFTQLGVVERFEPQAIAGEEEAALLAVPYREGKHTCQFRERHRAPARVRLKQDLRIRLGSEA